MPTEEGERKKSTERGGIRLRAMLRRRRRRRRRRACYLWKDVEISNIEEGRANSWLIGLKFCCWK
jgi:hypothetical protein